MKGSIRNIYEQQQANKRNTVLIMILFTLFVGFLGLGLDVSVFGLLENAATLPLPVATIIALGIGTASAFWSLQSGAKTVLSATGAQLVTGEDPRYQQLRNVVDEMTIASGLPRPQLYVIPDPDPNAFATGKDPDHACIAVTEGLLQNLNREEIQAVVAHEMSHVRNYDIRMMTVVAALIGAVMLLSEFGLRSTSSGIGRRRGSSRRGGGGGGIIILALWLLAMILAPLVSRILAMSISREREYLADASGAELTRNPAALASALEKIESFAAPTRSIKKGVAHLCIADPLGLPINSKEGLLAELLATHPPISKRIALLRAMSYQHW
jgi:heat shock protein HtpX